MARIVSYYETWAPDDLEAGETDNRGEDGDIEFDNWRDAFDYLGEALGDAEQGAEPSSSPTFHRGVWYSAYKTDEDFRTGEVTNRSYHLKDFTEPEEAAIWDALIDSGALTGGGYTRTDVDPDEADRDAGQSGGGFVIKGLYEDHETDDLIEHLEAEHGAFDQYTELDDGTIVGAIRQGGETWAPDDVYVVLHIDRSVEEINRVTATGHGDAWEAIDAYLEAEGFKQPEEQPDEEPPASGGFLIRGLGQARKTRRYRFLIIDESGRGFRSEGSGVGDDLDEAVQDYYGANRNPPGDDFMEYLDETRKWARDADEPYFPEDYPFIEWLEGRNERIEEIDSEPVEVEAVARQGDSGGFTIKG